MTGRESKLGQASSSLIIEKGGLLLGRIFFNAARSRALNGENQTPGGKRERESKRLVQPIASVGGLPTRIM